jgi:hypothetical protein
MIRVARVVMGSVVAGALAALFVFAAACEPSKTGNEGRFPVCKTNEDCAARLGDAGTGPGICWNLKCVECMYDTDCKPGSYCATDKLCEPVSPAQTEENGAVKWEPKNIDECLKDCKDATCTDDCTKRFPDQKSRGKR